MKEYIARLPKWGRAAIFLISLLAVAVYLWLVAPISLSKPTSEMPWYFWLLAVATFLMRWLIYVLPVPGNTPISEMSVGSALIRVVLVGFVTLPVIVSLVNGLARGIDIFFVAFWLTNGVRGVAALFLRLQDQQGAPILH